MNSAFEGIRRIVSDVLNEPLEQITADSSPATIQNWDSLQQLNLVLALEEYSGLQFGPEEIERMTNVGSIADLIEQKLAISGEKDSDP
jgi:acyl carrier protein